MLKLAIFRLQCQPNIPLTTMPALDINPKKVTRFLYLSIAFLAVLHIGNLVLYFVIDDPDKFDFIQLIDFDYEENLPTTFSSMLFFINAFLLWVVWRNERQVKGKDKIQWLVLSILFLYLGFDESAKIHENLGDIIETYIEAEGYLYFPWSIAYLSIFAVLVILYFPFFLRLPKSTKIKFVIAAIVFVTGAAGFDIISAKEAYENGTATIKYSVLYTIEELMEMIGLVLFTGALLEVIKRRGVSAQVI